MILAETAQSVPRSRFMWHTQTKRPCTHPPSHSSPNTYHQGDGKGEDDVDDHCPQGAQPEDRVVDGRGEDLDDLPSHQGHLLEGRAAAGGDEGRRGAGGGGGGGSLGRGCSSRPGHEILDLLCGLPCGFVVLRGMIGQGAAGQNACPPSCGPRCEGCVRHVLACWCGARGHVHMHVCPARQTNLPLRHGPCIKVAALKVLASPRAPWAAHDVRPRPPTSTYHHPIDPTHP